MGDSYLLRALNSALGVVLAVSAQVGAAAPSDPGPAPERRARPVAGRDISWPNCPKGLGIPSRRTQGKPMPPPGVPFVVLGLTNGTAFHPNPCLTEQVGFARALRAWASAYAVVTYPTRQQLQVYGAAGPRRHTHRAGRLWNTGWAQARQNVAAMREVGLDSPAVWIDVEPVSPPSPWSGNRRANRTVFEGALAYYRSAGLRVGVYSTQRMWRDIMGPVRYRLPEWRTAGMTSRRAALRMCSTHRYQGGRPLLTQWYTPDIDLNLVCPRASGVLARYFARLTG